MAASAAALRALATHGRSLTVGDLRDLPEPHVPVMRDRVVELLSDAPEGVIVDCTLGAGGHARGILEALAQGGGRPVLVGIDRDPEALELADGRLQDDRWDVHLTHARFDEIDAVLDELGIDRVAGVLYDLGISSLHVDEAERGFSYRQDGPLDMRMDPTRGRTAADLVNDLDQGELTDIIRRFGEERFAGRIAAAIVRARPLRRTVELAEVIRDAIPAATRRTGPHPATRTFQALRIAVNDELEAFRSSLPAALDRLVPGGICVTLAYHSLEDRIAKRTFRAAARDCICPPDLPVCGCDARAEVRVLTRRPERADETEIANNPRARSVRLRAVRKLDIQEDPT